MFFTVLWMWGDLRINQKQQPGMEMWAQGETKTRTKDVTSESEISARLKDGKLARRRTTTCSETDSSIHLASKQLFPFQGLIANCKDKSGKTLFFGTNSFSPSPCLFSRNTPYLSVHYGIRQTSELKLTRVWESPLTVDCSDASQPTWCCWIIHFISTVTRKNSLLFLKWLVPPNILVIL